MEPDPKLLQSTPSSRISLERTAKFRLQATKEAVAKVEAKAEAVITKGNRIDSKRGINSNLHKEEVGAAVVGVRDPIKTRIMNKKRVKEMRVMES